MEALQQKVGNLGNKGKYGKLRVYTSYLLDKFYREINTRTGVSTLSRDLCEQETNPHSMARYGDVILTCPEFNPSQL